MLPGRWGENSKLKTRKSGNGSPERRGGAPPPPAGADLRERAEPLPYGRRRNAIGVLAVLHQPFYILH